MDFFFCPTNTLENNILRVAPDILPPKSVAIGEVWINGKPHNDFDAEAMTVTLPANHTKMKVRVRLVPFGVDFTTDLLDLSGAEAQNSFSWIFGA